MNFTLNLSSYLIQIIIIIEDVNFPIQYNYKNDVNIYFDKIYVFKHLHNYSFDFLHVKYEYLRKY